MVLYWTGLGLVVVATLYALAILIFIKDPVVVSDFAPIIDFLRRNAARCRARLWVAITTVLGFILCAIGSPGIFAPIIYGVGAGVNSFFIVHWYLRRKFWLAWAAAIEEAAVSLLREAIKEL